MLRLRIQSAGGSSSIDLPVEALYSLPLVEAIKDLAHESQNGADFNFLLGTPDVVPEGDAEHWTQDEGLGWQEELPLLVERWLPTDEEGSHYSFCEQ